jgi:hypothetical protein
MAIGGHHSTRIKNQEWLTPFWILKELGIFDLDPCAPINRPWPTARDHYTMLDDGLKKDWHGRVWLNPPYDHKIMWNWIYKLSNHGNGIALIFARTETKGFFDFVWEKANALLFIKGRLSFYDHHGEKSKYNSGGPSVLAAYGFNNAEILKNCNIKGKYINLSLTSDPKHTKI